MLRIILATTRSQLLRPFAEALSSDPEVRLYQMASGAEVLRTVRTSSPHLVVIDFGLPDFNALDLVEDLLMVNAMVNTAVVSPLPEEQFHEVSEGLGILAWVPAEPDRSDAAELLRKLRKVLGQVEKVSSRPDFSISTQHS